MNVSEFIQQLNAKAAQQESKPKRKRSDPEHRLQVSCLKWFQLQYPSLRLNLFAIPNGSKRDKITGKRLKDEGVISGVADLFLSVPNDTYHGAFIEIKNGKKGKQSDNQKEFEKAVTAQGYAYHISRSLDDFISYVNSYLT